MADIMDHLAASPCCNPELNLDEAMSAYSKLGFRKFEVFDSWAGSAFDIDGDPAFYMGKSKEYGLVFSSMHLPAVGEDLDISQSVAGARFAEEIGCPIVLFKACDRKTCRCCRTTSGRRSVRWQISRKSSPGWTTSG